jgi:hypothetical protein
MNNQKKFNEDPLLKYISREKIEDAPEGFTSKVMELVRKESARVAARESVWKINRVPVVSVLVILSLFAVAFLMPDNQIDSISLPVLKLIKNLKFSLPEIDLSSLYRLTLPSVTFYTVIAIAFLTIFDKALSGIFKKMP